MNSTLESLEALLHLYEDDDGNIEVPLETLFNEINSKIPNMVWDFNTWEKTLLTTVPKLERVIKLLEKDEFRREKFSGTDFGYLGLSLDSPEIIKDSLQGKSGEVYLEMAIKRGYLKVLKYLASKGYREYIKDYSITIAAENGRLEVVKYLVSLGFNPTFNYNSAIRQACTSGHLEVIRYLREECDCELGIDFYLMRNVCGEGHLEVVRYLVEECGYDPRTDNGNNALVFSVIGGQLEVLKYLVSLGCDPRIDDFMRWSVTLEMTKYLIEMGCDIKAHSNVAIRNASERGDIDLVKFLYEKGCRSDRAVIEAINSQNLELIQFFRSKEVLFRF